MRVFLFIFLLYLNNLSAQPESVNFIDQNYLVQQRVTRGLVFDIIQDRVGYIWIATEHGLLRFDGILEKEYRYDPLDESSLSNDVVTSLAEDSLGNLWVGTMHAGLNYFDRQHNRFIRFVAGNDSCSVPANKINKILIDQSNKVWVSTEGGGLSIIKSVSGCFTRIQKPMINSNFTDALFESRDRTIWMGTYFGLNRKKPNLNVFDSLPLNIGNNQFLGILKVIEKDGDRNLWLGTRDHGLFNYDYLDGTIKKYSLTPTENPDSRQTNIWDMLVDISGALWVCTDGGLSIVEKDKAPFMTSSLGQTQIKRVFCIAKSGDGVIWLGTNSGVVVLVPRLKPFDLVRVYTEPGDSSIKRGITYVAPGRDDRIWIGTLRGLYTYLPEERVFSKDYLLEYPALKAFSNSTIFAFYQDSKSNYWISTVKDFNSGFEVHRYEPVNDKLIPCSPRCQPFRAHVTQNIVEDSQENLWFANARGLIRYEPETQKYHILESKPDDLAGPSSNFINRVFMSSNNKLWIGTNDAGLNQYLPDDKTFVHYPYKAGDSNALSDKRVMHILESRDHKLWIATAGGLNLFDPSKNTFKHFFKRDGLPNEYINGLVEDHRGVLWLTSPKSLVRFDEPANEIVHFDRADGIQQSDFWDRTSFKDNNNRIYFGGDDGLLIVEPDKIRLNDYLVPVVIHELYLLNKLVIPGKENSILREDLRAGSKIILDHTQNVFNFRFSGLNFIRPDKVQYAIKMEDFESDWQYIGQRRDATYTNLNPGKYTFRVKASNNDGIWNEQGTSIHLVVLAPWWNSTVARIIYLLMLTSLVYLFYRFQLNRQLQVVETRKLKELDAFKSRFYTNITHEFRTPLTLVLGPVDQAIKNKVDLKLPELQIVKRNASRVLQLINQLLHLSKLESGNLNLNYNQRDVISFIRYLTESFQSFATGKNIKLHFNSTLPALVMDVDAEKLTEIVTNILSNAIKFTPPDGSVDLHIETVPAPSISNQSPPKEISIKISDTGIGISEEKLPRIFDRFYTANSNKQEGTGIGLAIAKELTEALGGKISLQSVVAQGSIFTIVLPVHQTSTYSTIDQAMPKNMPVPYPVIHEQNVIMETDNSNQLPIALIIEDNADVAHFIAACLKNHYQVLTAINGSDGLSKAVAMTPDLILSDVMMPELDGFELTYKLKADPRTSHIPIILITARGDEASRLEGLKHRADAYLTKPFNQDELLVIMSNLMEMRKRLHAWYLQQLWNNKGKPDEVINKPIEHEFIKKMRLCCENHMNDAVFSIENLCHEIGMSHSQIHRKMVALTGQSVQKFLKKVRLEKAKEYLKSTDKTISEIAYDTGFSDPAYFTKVFTKYLGITPTEWRKQN